MPTTENMPGGGPSSPGDVLKIRNGKTVEVLNTDAEGRLILADGLSLAAEEKPDAIIDLATLTGACMVALGDQDRRADGQRRRLDRPGREAAADRAGEPVWPLPLPDEYRKDARVRGRRPEEHRRHPLRRGASPPGCSCRSSSATCRGSTSTSPGPARAAGDDGYIAKGGTGFGVRTLVEVLSTFEKPGAATQR